MPLWKNCLGKGEKNEENMGGGGVGETEGKEEGEKFCLVDQCCNHWAMVFIGFFNPRSHSSVSQSLNVTLLLILLFFFGNFFRNIIMSY